MTGGIWSQPVQMSLSETSLQLTKVSPTVATALAIAVFRLCRSGEKGDRWCCIFHGVWYNEREIERGNGICGKAE